MKTLTETKARAGDGGAVTRFMLLAAAAGGAAALASLRALQWSQLDWSFAVLAALSIGVGARAVVKIPRVKGEVTVSDAFIFLTMLLYDGEAAVLLACVEGFCSSLRITKRWLTVFFNAGIMGCSTFATVSVGRSFFGHLPDAATQQF